jgi:hypothetical protein
MSNNRIESGSFLNLSCVSCSVLESKLLVAPLKNLFQQTAIAAARASVIVILASLANSWPVYAIAGTVPIITIKAAPLAIQSFIIFIAVSIFEKAEVRTFSQAYTIDCGYHGMAVVSNICNQQSLS